MRLDFSVHGVTFSLQKESEKQAKLAAEIWTKEAPTAADEQRQEEEEFDEFLDDLLL